MTNDAELLRRYAEERSQDAFAELVRRHLGWVYHAGLRRAGGRHDLAEEMAQYVFTALANNAGSLARRDSLSGWLHLTVRYAASRALRTEIRRRKYETAVHVMTELENSARDPAWEGMRPALDEVLDNLPARDRETLLRRFFDGMGFAEIGVSLGLSEDGARQRVNRALEKLRILLARRGITSTSIALAALLSTEATAAVGSEVQAAITTAALSGAALPGTSLLGLLQFMSLTKATLGGVGMIAILLCIGTFTTAVLQTMRENSAAAELGLAAQQHAEAQTRLAGLEPGRVTSGLPPARPVEIPAGAVVVAAAGVTARDDGRAFLAAFGGKFREQYRAQSRREIEERYALFFKLAQLPAEKQQALVVRTLQLWEDLVEVTPNSILVHDDELPDAEVRAVLGAEAYQQWRDLVVRAAVAKNWSLEMAKAVSAGPDPLSLDQIAALHQIVRDNSTEYRNGRKINERTVDWETVAQQAQTALSETQWQHAQAFLLMRDATRALEKLADTGRKNGAPKKP